MQHSRLTPYLSRLEQGADLPAWIEQLIAPPAASAAEEPWILPRLDMVESQEAIRVTVELPGVPAGNVAVEVSGSSLYIKGRKQDARDDAAVSHRQERQRGRFCRILLLPAEVRPDAMSCQLADGVLTIDLPKVAAA